jgi:hypothetical protein
MNEVSMKSRLKWLSDDELVRLVSDIKEEQEHRDQEEARFAREGCRWQSGFLINTCATCGRDEHDMDDCPYRKAGPA